MRADGNGVGLTACEKMVLEKELGDQLAAEHDDAYVNVGDGNSHYVSPSDRWGPMEIVTVAVFGFSFIVAPCMVFLCAWCPTWYGELHKEMRRARPKPGQPSTAKYRSI